jgi:hypothetical protein
MQCPMAMARAMAMAMMSSEPKPLPMRPDPNKAHANIADFTEITVSHSDEDLCLGQATSARIDSGLLDG